MFTRPTLRDKPPAGGCRGARDLLRECGEEVGNQHRVGVAQRDPQQGLRGARLMDENQPAGDAHGAEGGPGQGEAGLRAGDAVPSHLDAAADCDGLASPYPADQVVQQPGLKVVPGRFTRKTHSAGCSASRLPFEMSTEIFGPP